MYSVPSVVKPAVRRRLSTYHLLPTTFSLVLRSLGGVGHSAVPSAMVSSLIQAMCLTPSPRFASQTVTTTNCYAASVFASGFVVSRATELLNILDHPSTACGIAVSINVDDAAPAA